MADGFDWGSVIQLAGNYLSSRQANKSNSAGTAAAVAGSQAAIDEQRREYDQSRADQAPWLHAGAGALGQMGALNGGDFSSFYSSPDYTYAVDQMTHAMDRSAASRGRLNSGGYGQDLTKAIGGLASQNYNNYYNRLQAMAGEGQTSANNLGSLGQSMANNMGAQYNNIGNARQSGYQQNGYNNAAMWSNLGSGLNQWYQSSRAPSSTSGSNPGSYYNFGNNMSNFQSGW